MLFVLSFIDIRSYPNVIGNLSIAQVLLKNPSVWPVRHPRHYRDNLISGLWLFVVCFSSTYLSKFTCLLKFKSPKVSRKKLRLLNACINDYKPGF